MVVFYDTFVLIRAKNLTNINKNINLIILE